MVGGPSGGGKATTGPPGGHQGHIESWPSTVDLLLSCLRSTLCPLGHPHPTPHLCPTFCSSCQTLVLLIPLVCVQTVGSRQEGGTPNSDSMWLEAGLLWVLGVFPRVGWWAEAWSPEASQRAGSRLSNPGAPALASPQWGWFWLCPISPPGSVHPRRMVAPPLCSADTPLPLPQFESSWGWSSDERGQGCYKL